MVLQPSNGSAVEAQIISAFWETYIPSKSNAQSGPVCTWLQQSIVHQHAGETLKLSLKALAMTRLGWMNSDDAVAVRGRVYYGRALQQVQKDLWSENMMWEDVTLAAGFVLSIYEVCLSDLLGASTMLSDDQIAV